MRWTLQRQNNQKIDLKSKEIHKILEMEVQQHSGIEQEDNQDYEMTEMEWNRLKELGSQMGNLNLKEKLETLKRTIAEQGKTLTEHDNELVEQKSKTEEIMLEVNNIKEELSHKEELKKLVEENKMAVKENLGAGWREAENTAKELSKAQNDNFEALQSNLMKKLKEGMTTLSSSISREEHPNSQDVNVEIKNNRYLQATRRKHTAPPPCTTAEKDRIPEIEELHRPERESCEVEDITNLQFYMNLEGNVRQ